MLPKIRFLHLVSAFLWLAGPALTAQLPVVAMEVREADAPNPLSRVECLVWIVERPKNESGGIGSTDILSKLEATPSHRCGVRIHGSTLRDKLKPSFAVEIWNADDRTDRDVGLLGMPAESDWILSGRFFFDRTLIRNPLAYKLAAGMGLSAPGSRFVEVYLKPPGGEWDDPDSYQGVHALTEKPKRGKHRIPVGRFRGFAFKIDRYPKSKNSEPFTVGEQGRLYWVYPRESEMETAHRNLILDHLTRMNTALEDHQSKDYADLIDLDSWIDQHMLFVLTKNSDGFGASTFFYGSLDGKVSCGPPWDFDRTMGCDGHAACSKPTYWNPFLHNLFDRSWWKHLIGNPKDPVRPEVWERWKSRWKQHRKKALSDETIRSEISDLAARVREAQGRNFERWPMVRPNGGLYASKGLKGWEAEISHLENWLLRRVAWIDSAVDEQ